MLSLCSRAFVMETTGKLSNLQLELLMLFRHELADKQLVVIKNILAQYFADSATAEMDKLWEENNWSNETMESWANERLRK